MASKKKPVVKVKEEKVEELNLVDQEFFVIQIEELNRKIARLESKCQELELENEVVRTNMEKLDEDRGDVISHLKRALQKKVDEVNELTERIDALQLAKETEGGLYKEKIKNMENDFKIMQEQMSSEIKLLNGKLNSLEEFRAQREELMNKYEKQERALEEQEKRHDQQLLDLEQSYLIRKERLKEEMETRLLKLSLDFQKATQMRIASTTQSVIRENIAVNNQLNILVAEWKKMCEDMEELKAQNKRLLIDDEINKKEKISIERKNIIQNQIIKKLSLEDHKLKERSEEMKMMKKQISMLNTELSEARRCEQLAIENLGLAKQHIHSLATSFNELKQSQNRQQSHVFKLEGVLSKASHVVRKVLKLSSVGESDEGTVLRTAELLKMLEELLDLEASKKEISIQDTLSMETLIGLPILHEKYKTGDLGIVPPKAETTLQIELYQDQEQDMTWNEDRSCEDEEQHGNITGELQNYIDVMHIMLVKVKAYVQEIIHLPKKGEAKMTSQEMGETREELLNSVAECLDLSLLQTLRPLAMPSLETILFPDGLLNKDLGFPTDDDVMMEYPLDTVEQPCVEQSSSNSSNDYSY